MTAWLMTQGEYSDFRVVAVFADEVTATTWAAAMNDATTEFYPYEIVAVPSIGVGATPEIEVEMRFFADMEVDGSLTWRGMPVDHSILSMTPHCVALGDTPPPRCESNVKERRPRWDGVGPRRLDITVYGVDHQAVEQTYSAIVARARANLSTIGRFFEQGTPVHPTEAT